MLRCPSRSQIVHTYGAHALNIAQAIILGIVEGVTEFLPVSSTGHLTVVEKLMGLPLEDAAVTALTAIIQVGAICAVILYFWRDIAALVIVWFRGIGNSELRSDPE
jgi:undecaprenyl-diphosphatase